jgi:hypothetical protein
MLMSLEFVLDGMVMMFNDMFMSEVLFFLCQGSFFCESFFNQQERAIVTSVMYSIWSSRNNLTHGDAIVTRGP